MTAEMASDLKLRFRSVFSNLINDLLSASQVRRPFIRRYFCLVITNKTFLTVAFVSVPSENEQICTEGEESRGCSACTHGTRQVAVIGPVNHTSSSSLGEAKETSDRLFSPNRKLLT